MSSDGSPYLSSVDNTLVDKRMSLPSYLRSPTVSEVGDFEATFVREETRMLSMREQEDQMEEVARRETYLTTPVAYMMGLIEGTPNTEFVSGPTRPEIQRALEILEEERSFVRHAQRALQIREGTIITRINAGERKLMGLQNLRDSFHPADDPTPSTEYHMPTTAVVSRASSSASNGAPLRPMPGTYPTRTDRERDVYRFTQVSPRYHITPARLGLIRPSTRTQPPLPFTEYDSSKSDTAPVILRPRGA
ncbi:hypothetical protein HETIRDRAFT_430369 [Heterobasidion irregulare TC 32-1]|uniref:Uncharacterized protein n=1 Tax=Heterobasidion irregulare (strain TC 32-1) TaxID=747525 RepID=W4JS11_HETIT|nr:uncharacterized protein HETIRDRAFT_430369 [Heterobasidion irregulare TC 32-1]ETW75885.1 hypothetical protein HETIRDRAFT_430369 [Heterobasidion irregulare TC 32-1]